MDDFCNDPIFSSLAARQSALRDLAEGAGKSLGLPAMPSTFMPEIQRLTDPVTFNIIRFARIHVGDATILAVGAEQTREMVDDRIPPATAEADDLIRTNLWYARQAIELGVPLHEDWRVEVRRQGQRYRVPIYNQFSPCISPDMHTVADLLVGLRPYFREEPLTKEEIKAYPLTLDFGRGFELGSEDARQGAVDELLQQCALAIWAWYRASQFYRNKKLAWRVEPELKDFTDYLGRSCVHLYARIAML